MNGLRDVLNDLYAHPNPFAVEAGNESYVEGWRDAIDAALQALPMKVWIVLGHEGWGEGTEVDSVFSTAEAAQAYYEEHRAPDDELDEVRRSWYVVQPRACEVDAAVAPLAEVPA